MIGGSKALKARPVKAMGATHGYDNRIRSGFWPERCQLGKYRFAKTVGVVFLTAKFTKERQRTLSEKNQSCDILVIKNFEGLSTGGRLDLDAKTLNNIPNFRAWNYSTHSN